jgi:serine/threonine protein phosphatase PrpC
MVIERKKKRRRKKRRERKEGEKRQSNNIGYIYIYIGIWDCMTNQEVVDFVHKGIKLGKRLEEICEDMMDHCVADEQTTNGLGYDNMSVIIVGILNGKSQQEWYNAIKKNSTVSVPNSPCSSTPSSPKVDRNNDLDKKEEERKEEEGKEEEGKEKERSS